MLKQFLAAIVIAWAGAVQAAENPGGLSDYQREAGQIMLKQVRRDIAEHHYDPAFKGLKLDAVVAEASARIAQAQSNAEVFRAIAGVTRAFGDSHTYFIPPRWGFDFDYGWSAMASGKACLIHRVKPGSDAAKKGLKVGDQLLAIDGAPVAADTLRAWMYLLNAIEPHRSLRLTVASPGEPARELEIATKVTERERNLDLRRDFDVLMRQQGDRVERGRNRYEEFDGVFVWRLKRFQSDAEITEGLAKIRGHDRLVLDLRGNPGGTVGQVLRVIAVLLGRDTKIGVERERDRVKPVVAELRREKPWTGKLMVLVDRFSGSGAEMVAAAVQQNGRGLLLGDRTAGAVQTGRLQPNKVGVDRLVFFGTVVAQSEFELLDGKKIEGVGVTPDFMMPLTGADLVARRDPTLARALKQLGVVRTPEQVAGVCWVFENLAESGEED